MMRTHKFAVLCCGFFLLVVHGQSVAQTQLPNILPGLWQVDIKVMMASRVAKAYSTARCFTRATMHPENIFQQDDCQMSDLSLQSHRARWAMSCTYLGMKMQGLGVIHFQQRGFSGEFNMTVANGQMGGVALQTKLSGHYLGACREQI